MHIGWGTVNRDRKLRQILGRPLAFNRRINQLFA